MKDLSTSKSICRLLRYDIITSTTEAGSGHPTSCLSAVELAATLFFGGFYRYDIKDPRYIFNDRFILSKGHAAPLLYALYHVAGSVSKNELKKLRTFDSVLEGHPTPRFRFVDYATGSLGQGLSLAIGHALGIRLHLHQTTTQLKRVPKTWVLLGDSEMAEGQIWESLEIASHYQLNSIVGILDINRLGQTGETMLAWDLGTYEKRISAFGWDVIRLENGHNLEEIHRAFEAADMKRDNKAQKPVMIIARTVKGKGVSFLENKSGWHGKPVPKERLQEALKELEVVDLTLRANIHKPEKVPAEQSDQKLEEVCNKLSDLALKGGRAEGSRHARMRKSSIPVFLAQWEPSSRQTRQLPTRSKQGIFAFPKSTGSPRFGINDEAGGRSERQTPSAHYKKGETVSTRKAFGDALLTLGKIDPRLVVFDAEVANSTYENDFASGFPDRFFEMFIDEENMVTSAVGISKTGWVPVVSTFAAFLTRAFDQIRMAQYSQANLKIVGTHAGVSIGQDGPSQMGLEDIAMIRSILHSTVVYPSDAVSAYKLTEEIMKDEGLSYLRATRSKTPVIYEENEKFPLGGSKILFESPADCVVIFAAGITLHESIKAYHTLRQEGLSAAVVDLYSVKPLDEKTVVKLGNRTKKVIVVEDHYPQGGLGEAVLSAFSSSKNSVRLHTYLHLCIHKTPRSGSSEDLLQYEGIDAESIVRAVKKMSP